ncbi:MAG: iron-sulfur protein, partial [Acinetobacter sp.]|nr:iron-sulfur protein [Acinetobacter sp.]
PVDCIDLIPDVDGIPTEILRKAEQDDLRQRYYAHIQREEKQRLHHKGPVVRAEIDTALFAQFSAQNDAVPDIQILDKEPEMAAKFDAKSTIELAKLRVQIKKLEKQLSVREDTKKRLLLDDLTQQLHQLQGA